jgi:hypothetical protein
MRGAGFLFFRAFCQNLKSRRKRRKQHYIAASAQLIKTKKPTTANRWFKASGGSFLEGYQGASQCFRV